MQLNLFCEQAEGRLEGLRTGILASDPARMDQSTAELEELINSLDGQFMAEARPRAQDRILLVGLRESILQLGAQLEQATNLCWGWAQLRIGGGYTQQGQPVLTGGEANASYEA